MAGHIRQEDLADLVNTASNLSNDYLKSILWGDEANPHPTEEEVAAYLSCQLHMIGRAYQELFLSTVTKERWNIKASIMALLDQIEGRLKLVVLGSGETPPENTSLLS